MKNEVRKQWVKENWFWGLVYVLVFAYFVVRYVGLSSDPGLDQWSHVKQAMALPLVIFLVAVFVNLFTNPISLPPAEGMKEPAKTDALEKNRKNMSLQRRNWMIFAYGFMLFALLVPIYIFGPGWDGTVNLTQGNASGSAQGNAGGSSQANSGSQGVDSASKSGRDPTDVLHPIAIFVGCAKDGAKKELSCSSAAQQTDTRTNPEPEKQADTRKQAGVAKQAGAPKQAGTQKPDDNQQPAASETESEVTNSAWVLNLGGHVINASVCQATDGTGTVCQVRGGLLVPLYVIILALLGGSISLTRRLPEYQKCANPEYVSTEKESKLTQHEFREYLVFQMVQFVSAPLIAILAYFLVDPSTTVASVALAFTSGFASESILLMVRAAAEKVSPKSESPKTGTVSGVVTLASGGGQSARNAEVALTASPQVRAVTDESGFYVLNNVPVGEHGIKVSLTDYEPITASVKLERAQELVKQHWVLKKKAKSQEVSHDSM